MLQRWLGNQLRQPRGLFSKWIGNYMQKGNLTINRWTTEVMDLKGKAVILEIGIGNGATLHEIVKTVDIGSATGIDISNEMLKQARKRNLKYIEQGLMELRYGDVMDLPFEDIIFDKVFSIHTIYFWIDLNRSFSEIHRVLKPGGKVYISITDRAQMEKMQRTNSFTLLDVTEIENLLQRNHFTSVKRHSNGVFWCLEATKG
ncbi:class I SAM-dependent methyltransferase [Ornithinibacillus scapharcae]|uniref:class I SAM-dependent methyltransferase n=1 Tax=Ornithinibacillus scapharcae TaxID=1147159 RepID=UPI000225B14E|nr:class I SAM-dependent methyltransferase [Ornithinibacillus scapharcae]